MNAADQNAAAFIVFSDDWGEHPSSCQHLFRQLLPGHRVIWVNTIGMRAPKFTLGDLRKIVRKVAKMFASRASGNTAVDAAPRPEVCQPFMLPFSAVGAVRGFNRRSVIRDVRRRARALGVARPVVVSTVPNACDYVDAFGAERIVYYCVDDFSQWPGLEHALVREMEASLVSKADVLIATSRNLYARLSAAGRSVQLLTHGVDLEHFSRIASREHACLAQIPGPRVGYFGLFDERSNQALLAAVARAMPDVSFVITGPVVTDVSSLRACPNVHFTGPLPYRELPELIKGLDALFIPYVVDEFTDSISPLKLKEYLVTGKPVVVTPIAEARLNPEFLSLAATPVDWVNALRAALAGDSAARRAAALVSLQDESWSHKARLFERLCSGVDAMPAKSVA